LRFHLRGLLLLLLRRVKLRLSRLPGGFDGWLRRWGGVGLSRRYPFRTRCQKG